MTAKYKNKKVTIDGYKFDSLKESRRYIELKYMLKAGEITDLELQKRFELVPKSALFLAVYYDLDFYYKLPDGTVKYEDVKPSFNNLKFERKYKSSGAYRVFKIKQKLMYEKYKIYVEEV